MRKGEPQKFRRKVAEVEAVQCMHGGISADFLRDDENMHRLPDGGVAVRRNGKGQIAEAGPGDWLIREPDGMLVTCWQRHFTEAHEPSPPSSPQAEVQDCERREVDFNGRPLQVTLPSGGTASVLGYVVSDDDDGSLQVMVRDEGAGFDRDDLLAALDAEAPGKQSPAEPKQCDRCGGDGNENDYSTPYMRCKRCGGSGDEPSSEPPAEPQGDVEKLARKCAPGDQWPIEERWREAGQDASVFDDDTDPDYIDLISDAAAKKAIRLVTPLLALEVKERLEGAIRRQPGELAKGLRDLAEDETTQGFTMLDSGETVTVSSLVAEAAQLAAALDTPAPSEPEEG